MTITLLNLNWGYQVVWQETNQVLDIIEDTARPGPHRSRSVEIEAEAKLAQHRNSNLFAPNVKEYEKAILTIAIQDTRPGWQFHRGGSTLLAWKDCWGGVMVNGKTVEPLKARSAQKLAGRIRLYEEGKQLVKGRLDGIQEG